MSSNTHPSSLSNGELIDRDWLVGGGEMGKFIRAMDWTIARLLPEGESVKIPYFARRKFISPRFPKSCGKRQAGAGRH